MVFHWSLSDSKQFPVFWILFCILADLNNAVVWIVSTCPLISKSSSPCVNPLLTVLKHLLQLVSASHSCSSFYFSFPLQDRSTYLSFHFLLILFGVQPRYLSPQFGKFIFFIIIRSVFLAEIRWYVCISKSLRSLCLSFARTDSGLSIYHLCV